MSKMFPFITETFNPLGGECKHNCPYCWAKDLIKTYNMQKYAGNPKLIKTELKRKFTENDFVFICDMLDMLGDWVPDSIIQEIINYMAASPAKFLVLTKNPKRFHYFTFPKNCVLGCTIETNRNEPILGMVTAREYRLQWMAELYPKVQNTLFLSIEPIMDFDLVSFALWIAKVHPEFVVVGYDNYKNNLPEPPLEKTLELISLLEQSGIKVCQKTLREKVALAEGEKNKP